MPRATVSKRTERKELLTVPAKDGVEAGWVELRRMSFGEKLEKDAEAMKMRFAMDGNASDVSDVNAEVAVVNVVATLLEFQRCVVNHNLTTLIDPDNEDGGERPLNFQKAEDVRVLDPRIGSEISDLIGEMNDFERAARTSKLNDEGK